VISAVMPTYARIDIAFERGEGPYLFTAEGKRYLDFASGIAVNVLGHGHPHLVARLKEQVEKLWHCSNLYRVPEQERLAARLVEHSFADTVFFCNSGAEANECAIKIARKYHDETGHPERHRIIVCNEAFHGRTLATMAAGGQAKILKGFDPVTPGFDHVALNNTNELRAAVGPETAAILIEPVQMEGGVRVATAEFLQAARRLADEQGLLLIFDEVQTGMGHTGKLFAYELAGVAPDIMPLAKGLGGGFPIGACLATEKAAVGMTAGSHGSTFGGTPIACAAANAVLDVLTEPGFFDQVQKTAAYFRGKLESLVRKHPKVFSELRGQGLLFGLKCVGANTELGPKLRAEGLLTVNAGENVIRIMPPLNIETRHADEALAILDKVAGSA
jgi:acetylornithine/N-succinyldiaminopimelate aminotransferase